MIITIGTIIYPIAIGLGIPTYLFQLVLEKEEKIRENMKMNGMKMSVYWFTNVIFFFGFYSLTAIIFWGFFVLTFGTLDGLMGSIVRGASLAWTGPISFRRNSDWQSKLYWGRVQVTDSNRGRFRGFQAVDDGLAKQAIDLLQRGECFRALRPNHKILALRGKAGNGRPIR